MTLPRLLVIMGSGETAPTMKVPHRRVFEHLAADGIAARPIMLDTPFGFQENAPILAAATTKYFSDSVSQNVAIAGLTRTDAGDSAAVEASMSAIRDANWVFAGPGSPTYALRQWQGTGLRDILAEKLIDGGAIVFSSAAALTLGCVTVPVYEIYKVGMDPWWEPGLDLLAEIGVNAAVIPHYDNQEGGNHDTRFCYLGERRLAMLEPLLPEGAFVLGIDEHTGIVMNLDADTAEIVGKGGVTVRRNGDSVRFETGQTVPLDVIRTGGDIGSESTSPASTSPSASPSKSAAPTAGSDEDRSESAANATTTSLGATAKLLEASFTQSIATGDSNGAVRAILDLDSAITEWSADTLQSDEMDQARRALRSMIVKLGSAATVGLRDERDVLGPVVEAALAARRVAREEKAYAVSDAVRDGLDAAGIEVRDTADGVEWVIKS
jgi:cyanophycinase-like exopeptidase